MGFVGISSKCGLFKKRDIFLIEDACESHGIKLGNKKGGSLGNISNFHSYSHHVSRRWNDLYKFKNNR